MIRQRNVTSRVFTSHVFQRTGTIFELNSYINKTNVLTKFHDDWAKMKTSPSPWQPCFSRTGTIFELNSHWTKNVTSRVFKCFHYIHIAKTAPPLIVHDINKTNVLTKFHDDWAKIVTSIVLTMKTAPPTGGHVFQRNGTTFELSQHIIKTNIFDKVT
ncbi:hypothetical protein DPMN_176587 [Dreissena polymorpha]|uniref:Uncharacterized protein n=1 Tax=Dreissena polymorpha TaxID=45954 RepID=A0A9D4IKR5_DREPO|nr:hypothetical protein DPMN_176587 [Dreissena polymorpha]